MDTDSASALWCNVTRASFHLSRKMEAAPCTGQMTLLLYFSGAAEKAASHCWKKLRCLKAPKDRDWHVLGEQFPYQVISEDDSGEQRMLCSISKSHVKLLCDKVSACHMEAMCMESSHVLAEKPGGIRSVLWYCGVSTKEGFHWTLEMYAPSY